MIHDYSDPNKMWQQTGYDPYKGMDDKQRQKAGCLELAIYLVTWIAAVAVLAMFAGCTTTRYVAVPQHHTDTLRITQHQRDSIYMHDSIYVSEKQRGDTIVLTTDRWHTQWRDRWHTDTIYKSRVDSVVVPVTESRDTTLTAWQRFRMSMGDMMLIAIVMMLLIFMVKRR